MSITKNDKSVTAEYIGNTEMQKNARLSLDIMGRYADELKNLKDRGVVSFVDSLVVGTKCLM